MKISTSDPSHWSDPEIPYLHLLLNPEAVGQTLNELFRQESRAPLPEITSIKIERITYHPKNNCRVLYRIQLADVPDSGEAEEWICAQMYASRYAPKRNGRLKQQLSANPQPVGSLPAVLEVPEWDLLFWIFPGEPKLKHLHQVVQPEFIIHHIQDTMGRHVSVSDCRIGKVKYMPLKRCVLRLHFRLSSDEDHEVCLYSKTYNDGKSRHHFHMLRRAYEELTQRRQAVIIPRPVCFFKGYHTFWQEAWPGVPLIEEVRDREVSDLFYQIGGLMARMHGEEMADLPAAPDMEAILNTAREDGLQFIHLLPHFKAMILPALERLQKNHIALQNQSVPLVPLHGAWRIEQMLLSGQEMALIDFDAFSVGDPHSEVAEFLASLSHLELTHGWSPERIENAGRSFLKGYVRQVSFDLDDSRLMWYILAFMMSKIYAAIKHLDFTSLKRLDTDGERILHFWSNRLGVP